jgi:glutathione synthase/RimK-type ligase-like ATP-grasp enzyme
LSHPGFGTLDLTEIAGVWWRRGHAYGLEDAVAHPQIRTLVEKECAQAFRGALETSVRNFFNRPSNSRTASLKLKQLQVASTLGLRVPETMVTNDPEAAFQFVAQRRGDTVYKLFSGTDFGVFETRQINSTDDLTDLWRARYCPVLLQRQIHGDYDVRVSIIGPHVFAAAIHYKAGRHPVDGRIDRSVPIRSIELPAEISTKLLQLTSHFGLTYGAIDLRYSADDGFTFFEINPDGQYLWIEIETGLPISDAIAAQLLGETDG